jgi:hypothetical protein
LTKPNYVKLKKYNLTCSDNHKILIDGSWKQSTELEHDSYENTIELYGVGIIPNVLNENECDLMVNQIWDFFEHITKEWEIPINRNNKDTWREFYKLYPMHSMLIQHWGIGQIQASWNIRQNINIVKIFSYFWGTPFIPPLVSKLSSFSN